MKNIKKKFAVLSIVFMALYGAAPDCLYAAPSNGTRMPPGGKLESGYEYNVMFERPMSHSFGDLSTQDHLYTLTLGVFDWLALDGQIGLGDVTEKNGKLPTLDYNTAFAGGYGFRIRAYDNKEWGVRVILGGEHICVHPQVRSINNDKYEAILDDWQASALVAKDFRFVTVYTGMKASDCQLIYTLNKHDRKRVSSDQHIGLITGLEVYLFKDKKTRVNVEGRFFDETALSTSVSYLF